MVASNERLETGAGIFVGPDDAVCEGSPVYFFDFGVDYYGAVSNIAYEIEGGPIILSNTATHFASRVIITPPAGGLATVRPTRVSEIPPAWMSNTTTDGLVHEYGFFAAPATEAPSAAAALFPSVLLALSALLAALVF